MPLINRIYGLSSRCDRMKFKFGARFFEGIIRLLFQASIPGQAKIAPTVFFHHSGIGVVINRHSVIEENCEIGVHVVLGGKSPLPGAPHLEPGVIVHAGAKLIGPIRIGAGSVVAANAVVTKDVPPRCLVAGVPAVIKKENLDPQYHKG
ncbi:MAG: serine O-acetyltransferase [Asticcacaulis sp.]